MEARIKAIEKIILSRRILATSKFMEESKLCSVTLLQLQKQYLHILQQLHFIHTAKISLEFERSRCKTERTHTFWEKECQLAEESIFRHNFRMSRNNFNKLCKQLSGLQQSCTDLGKRITLQKGIAIALYALGSTEDLRKIGKMFGVKVAAVINIILSFCEEVWKFLGPIHLNNFPLKKEKVETLMEEFEERGFPQCMGALSSCQIGIKAPSNRSAEKSVVLLTLVDARCRFIYVNCGSPPYHSDSQIYQESSLKQYLDHCSLLLELQKNISDVDVPVLMIGDSAFQLSEKLMTPYTFSTSQNQQQKLFNRVLSKSLNIAKKALLQLKARFRRIERGVDDTVGNWNAIVLACCVLHNFLNENDDIVNEDWLQISEPKRSYTEHNPAHLNNNPKAIRLAIASYLSGNHISDDYNESEGLNDNSESEASKVDNESGNSGIDISYEVSMDYVNIDELMSE